MQRGANAFGDPRRGGGGGGDDDYDDYGGDQDGNKNVAPDKLKSILRKIIMIGRLAEPVSILFLILNFQLGFLFIQAGVNWAVISNFYH